MPESPPRLASADPGTQAGYAPLSWTAVSALVLAGLYALVMAIVLFFAFRRGQQVIEPMLLFFPALVIVLVFVARRQIRSSEGTRVGEQYANLAWWIAVVCGLGYVTYLFAIDFAIRRQADAELITWSNYLKDLNPSDPKDPNFFHAVHMTIDPGVRGSVPASDPSRIEATFRDSVVGMRNADVVRVCARNRGAIEFRPQGLKEWQQKPNEITCTLSATLLTPEGEHGLVIPMRAVIDEKTKARRWQILPIPGGGYIKARRLTPYGWQVEYLEAMGQRYAQDFLGRLSSPGASASAFYAFIQPGWDAKRASQLLNGLTGIAGGPATLLPYPPGGEDYLAQKVFSKSGGTLEPADLARFKTLWNTQTRFVPAGTYVRNNPDSHPTLIMEPDAVNCRVPIEIQLGNQSGGPGAAIARGAVILRVTRQEDPAFIDELNANRTAGRSAGMTDKPESSTLTSHVIPWRVIRIESDLRPMSPQERGEPERGMPGGMPGM